MERGGDQGPWHVRAIRLPDGVEPEEWWIADGMLYETPIAEARDLPGGWFLPGGLIDAHAHLTMNFNGFDLPDGSEDLIAANLQAQRDSLSAGKTNARLALDQATSALTQAQSAYSTALQNWQYVQDTGNDPVQPTRTNAQGKAVANTLNDAQRRQYYDTFVQAEASLHSAEEAVRRSSPLPVPDDVAIFNSYFRVLTFRFNPEDL